MRVLLLSRNRVVQELVKLGIGDSDRVELEIVDDSSELQGDRYDLLLLDERFFHENGSEAWEHLIVGRRVMLGDPGEEHPAELFDAVLSKPFLPADIRRILEEGHPSGTGEREVEDDLGRFLEEERRDTEVLDEEEIRRIRRLLNEEEDGEESEEELSSIASPGGKSYGIDELLELLDHSRVKKLRKLLRGAKIQITIEFPEGE